MNEPPGGRKRFPRWQRHRNAWQPCGHTSLYLVRYIESSEIETMRQVMAGSREQREGVLPLLLADALAAIRNLCRARP